jgi:hypothetical protein
MARTIVSAHGTSANLPGPCQDTNTAPASELATARWQQDDATARWGRIYVGVLTRVEAHPYADREVVVEVDTGWGRLIVVTGGPHVAVGRKVAVALPGAGTGCRFRDVAASQAEEGAHPWRDVGGDAVLRQGARTLRGSRHDLPAGPRGAGWLPPFPVAERRCDARRCVIHPTHRM